MNTFNSVYFFSVDNFYGKIMYLHIEFGVANGSLYCQLNALKVLWVENSFSQI